MDDEKISPWDALKRSNELMSLEMIGNYFKEMFLDNIHLKPTEAKILFSKKFNTIDLSTPEISKIIKNKYRLCSQINSDKIKNSNNLLILKDNNNNIISHKFCYFHEKEDSEKKNEYKFIIIVTESQISNLKNNLIDEYHGYNL